MVRSHTIATAFPFLALAMVGCSDSSWPPTAWEPPAPLFLVEPVLNSEIGDAVVTSSAFDGARPAREFIHTQPIAELPGAELSGVVVHVGRGCIGDPYLDDPAGAIALIERGDCLFRDKILRAESEGAIGVIVYNRESHELDTEHDPESLPEVSVGEPPISFPGVFVQRSTGLLLRDGVAPVTALIRPAAIENLEDAVQTLVDAGILSHGQAHSLFRKLELARAHIENGNIGGALGVLDAFISEVRDLVEEGVIAAADGERLIAAAEALMSSLSP